MPASTAAMTTIFLPALSAANGFGRRGGCALTSCAFEKILWSQFTGILTRDSPVVTAASAGGGTEDGFNLASPLFVLFRRWRRGGGRGVSGRMSNKLVSSFNVGIGVVRALETQFINAFTTSEHEMSPRTRSQRRRSLAEEVTSS